MAKLEAMLKEQNQLLQMYQALSTVPVARDVDLLPKSARIEKAVLATPGHPSELPDRLNDQFLLYLKAENDNLQVPSHGTGNLAPFSKTNQPGLEVWVSWTPEYQKYAQKHDFTVDQVRWITRQTPASEGRSGNRYLHGAGS